MKNIHLLPTPKPSRLYKTGNFLLLDSKAMPNNTLETINQNIYITSDEEIKDYDWYISSDGKLLQFTGRNVLGDKFKAPKVILTTDQDLIKDGVQAIDDEFLEWFVKNANESGVPFDRCEFEEVYPLNCCIKKQGKTKANNGCMERNRCLNYKIIIPQEEPKQETPEEAAERYIDSHHMLDSNSYNGFMEGAKWQAERMYSEEEVFRLTLDALGLGMRIRQDQLFGHTQKSGKELHEEWFDEHKKK